VLWPVFWGKLNADCGNSTARQKVTLTWNRWTSMPSQKRRVAVFILYCIIDGIDFVSLFLLIFFFWDQSRFWEGAVRGQASG
jgi:hypothetical protein